MAFKEPTDNTPFLPAQNQEGVTKNDADSTPTVDVYDLGTPYTDGNTQISVYHGTPLATVQSRASAGSSESKLFTQCTDWPADQTNGAVMAAASAWWAQHIYIPFFLAGGKAGRFCGALAHKKKN
jgi:hypothetical protein